MFSLISNILGYWKLDGNSNDAVATNNGTDTNITYSTGNGKINQGAGFNGSSSQITTASSYGSVTDFSMSVWFETSYSGSSYNVFAELAGGATGSQTAYAMFRQSGSGETPHAFAIALQIGGTTVKSTGAYNDGTFHHAVCTMSGTTGTLYIDGAQAAQNASMTTINNTVFLRLGVDNTGSANWMNGALDEFGFWSRALTSAEVTQLYNAGTGIQYPFGTNVVGGTLAMMGV